jgi:hypothetical protein
MGKMMRVGLYPCLRRAYKQRHVAADDHKHYLPGGLIRSFLPGTGVCVCAPLLLPFLT